MIWAHPRSRGENSSDATPAKDSVGSSPLTRGKHTRREITRNKHGLIPAHAGKTIKPALKGFMGVAHPRSRGENSFPGDAGGRGLGSSPLTRGKHQAGSSAGNVNGLIPAHAGKTRPESRRPTGSRAHPRSRGENMVWEPIRAYPVGSSPLTRGKRVPPQGHGEAKGLIPAHAGKTTNFSLFKVNRMAHPRSRGENLVDKPNVLAHLGSSPLTRGKLEVGLLGSGSLGLIPAHAGKTSDGKYTPSEVGAHPRSRGENSWTRPASPTRSGSSPLTRGKLAHVVLAVAVRGLIPAHAGKTRGVYRYSEDPEGSSPLTRGKQGDWPGL